MVLVSWVDSCSNSGWQRFNDAPKGFWQPSRCETVGFLIHDSKHAITLALSRGADEFSSDFSETMTIPRVAITKIKKLA
jgi:hypothetical protein